MMWLWLALVIVLSIVILGIFINEEILRSGKKPKRSTSGKSVTEIVKEVTTITQYRALERKVDRADEKRQQSQGYDARSLKAEERAEEKYQVLQEAFDIASNKVLRWQFIPEVDLGTPLDISKSAYKVFPAIEYEDMVHELGNKKEWWYGLRGDEEPDEKDEETIFIFKFRKIVENSGLSDDQKSKKINSLVSRNADCASNYFDIETNIKPAEQWRKTNN